MIIYVYKYIFLVRSPLFQLFLTYKTHCLSVYSLLVWFNNTLLSQSLSFFSGALPQLGGLWRVRDVPNGADERFSAQRVRSSGRRKDQLIFGGPSTP